jgi:DNA-binding protein
MGKAINKAVTIAEILKRKLPLHQITTLSSCEIVNVYEPLEEGLDMVVNQHYVSCLTITLSEDSSGIDVNDKGYQVMSSSYQFLDH